MIRDDYAGPGGWSEGLRALGIHDVGIEWDRWACATRAAAGHLTIRADLATYRTPAEPVEGYLASPPCQTFSTAGKGEGRAQLDDLRDIIARRAWAEADELDARTRHVIDTARNCAELAPRWICLEQVPAVLPLWQQVARMLDARGYSVWTGVLNAADYGVPQTRRRAVLIASLDRPVSCPPPTHAQHPAPTLFGPALAPWVTMAEALGWVDGVVVNTRGDRGDEPAGGNEFSADRPSWAMTGKARSWVLDRHQSHGGIHDIDSPSPSLTTRFDQWSLDRRQQHDGKPVRLVPSTEPAPTLTGAGKSQWVFDRPATTVCGDPRLGAPGHRDRAGGEPQFGADAIRLTIDDALALQSFPAGYPVQGTRSAQFLQVGNAIPPRLAMHVAAEALGVDLAALEAAS